MRTGEGERESMSPCLTELSACRLRCPTTKTTDRQLLADGHCLESNCNEVIS